MRTILGLAAGSGRTVVILAIVLACVVQAYAEGDWAAVRQLLAGTVVRVTSVSGSETRGVLVRVTDEEIALTLETGLERRIPRTEVQAVSTAAGIPSGTEWSAARSLAPARAPLPGPPGTMAAADMAPSPPAMGESS